MKKYIISGLLFGSLCSSHLNLTMTHITSKIQQPFTAATKQKVTTSAYKKFMPQIIPATYNYGKQKIKTAINQVIKAWNHPLYTELIEPIYVGIELQHGWAEKKYKQLMWLKKQFQSDDQDISASENDTPEYPKLLKQRYAKNPLQNIPSHTLELYTKAMKRYEHTYQRFIDHKDNSDDFFDYQELQNATNDLYLIMNQIQEILEEEQEEDKKEQDISNVLPDQKPFITDRNALLSQTRIPQGPTILPPD